MDAVIADIADEQIVLGRAGQGAATGTGRLDDPGIGGAGHHVLVVEAQDFDARDGVLVFGIRNAGDDQGVDVPGILPADDKVVPVAGEHDRVGADAAIDRVPPAIWGEQVIVRAADQGVVAPVALNGVIADAAVELGLAGIEHRGGADEIGALSTRHTGRG